MMVQRCTFVSMNSDGTANVIVPTVSETDPVIASICCPPGVIPQFEAGEVLFVDWLGSNEYVILGSQWSSSKANKKSGSILATSVSADGGILGDDVTIGGVKAKDVAELKQRVTNLETKTNGWLLR